MNDTPNRLLEHFRRLAGIFLAVNVVALFCFGGCWVYSAAGALHARLRVTELDRAEVLNVEKLRKLNPALAANPRNSLGPWIAAAACSNARLFAQLGVAASVVNIALVTIAMRYMERIAASAPAEQPES
jgi:hypothetical protein